MTYTTDELFSGDNWLELVDCICEAYDFNSYLTFRDGTKYVASNIPKDKIRMLFELLPQHTKDIARTWGLNDTVFRDEFYLQVKKSRGIKK